MGVQNTNIKIYTPQKCRSQILLRRTPSFKKLNLSYSTKKELFLLVTPNGSKYWRMKYRFNGKEKLLSFGTYPETSLKEARNKRDAARKQIQEGCDPSQEKKLAKLTRLINSKNSFENVAREWHEKQNQRLTAKHSKTVLKRLETDMFPLLGSRPINQITAPELLVTIQKIEKRGAIDLAHRAMQTVGQILRYAIAIGRAQRDISADLRGALTVRKKVNHANLKEDERKTHRATFKTGGRTIATN